MAMVRLFKTNIENSQHNGENARHDPTYADIDKRRVSFSTFREKECNNEER